MENIDQHTQSLSDLLQAFAPLMQTYRNMSAAAASFQQSTAALKMQFTELNPLIQTQTTFFQEYFSAVSALVTKLSEWKGNIAVNCSKFFVNCSKVFLNCKINPTKTLDFRVCFLYICFLK